MSAAVDLKQLEHASGFVGRHIGPSDAEITEMLAELGLSSLDELIEKVVPDDILSSRPLSLPEVRNEHTALSDLLHMSERNKVFISMIGAGYYGTVMPTVILRNVFESPAWYTAYTPYQAEISQGRLEALLNFQQMICDLTGMELANASLLDEATAAAEAMSMSRRLCDKESAKVFLIDRNCFSQTIEVVQTRALPMGFEVVVGDPFGDDIDKYNLFGVLVQYPGADGRVPELRQMIEKAHASGTLVTVAADILGLALLTPPGEMDADIVVGSSQRFGVPMGYGGPHAAFFATREKYKRTIPGRIIGVSVDSEGKPALRMALQTREQHIRREKATSNICTAQVLLAVIAGLHGVYHGAKGIKRIAERTHRMTQIMVTGLEKLGFKITTDAFFDTITVRVNGQAQRIAARARESRINLFVADWNHLRISFDETTDRENLIALWEVFDPDAMEKLDINALDAEVGECIPEALRRTSEFMTHPVFNRHHTETEMMRYLRRLSSKDIALNRSMIPLGSCTMKLNSASEMDPVTWRNFAHMHPFAPLDQTQGYQQLFKELEDGLCEITGFDAFSLQPNAGSQGEYSGLMVIRKYHETRGEKQRNICLIPESAHGTNPASSIMAGMKVIVIKCSSNGDVDVEDLKQKAEEHKNTLAAIMVTYPSTHGIFEKHFKDICNIVHTHGGQVYLDGANMNAMVGIVRPGEIGADVSHLNLHKTFCIPHGGGGPGMGPIGVKAHLAPFLPRHSMVTGLNPAEIEKSSIGTISATPWGSSSILPITWCYIAMMGAEGLRRATQAAILNANYIRHRLAEHYPILYTQDNGFVAHECIIDLRPIRDSCGITVDDVAKRLIDYCFHAPTISFPVAGTMMIEPTESESKEELDRFCNAMTRIRKEIADIEEGRADKENNLLRNAPHPHTLLLEENWRFPYSKQDAFFPMQEIELEKYWPPVGRIDNSHGDRNLVCSCPPIEDYL